MDFEFFKDDKYHRCFVLKDQETSETHPDLDYLDLYFIELEKFEKKHQTVKTILDRWVKFLNNADFYSRSTLPQELAEIEPIRKASAKLEVMYLDQKEREYYEAQQKRYLDETSRIQEAVEQAVEKAVGQAVEKAVGQAVEQAELNRNVEIARKMILVGSEDSFIAQMTDLTVGQIEQLRSGMK
jgi:predicted transposase/invertase (TIGR01784 family)